MALFQSKPQIMGILNLTEDSFSDGGYFISSKKVDLPTVIDHASQMVSEGVDWFDIGAESTRPGALPIAAQQQIDRVAPVIEALSRRFNVNLSVDTSAAEVINSAAEQGAVMVNDVRALQQEGALTAAVKHNLAVCLMHMHGAPQTMQEQPRYSNVVEHVYNFLQFRIKTAIKAGIAADKICIDPGFGFGKTLEHNVTLLQQLPVFTDLNCPLLVGVSRKSMLQSITGRPVEQRDIATALTNSFALSKGARILRVHNVAAARDCINMTQALYTV